MNKNKNLKIHDSEESEAEKIPKLLKRLDEIKRRIYSGEESEREELEGFAEGFREARVDSSLSTYVEATIFELEGKLMERKENYEEAKNKYREAAEKLVQWTELTAKELIGKSILLRSTRSLEEAKEAYKRLKKYIEGQPLRTEGSIQALIDPTSPFISSAISTSTTKGEINKSYEKESSAWGKIVLKLVEMGKLKIAFTMVKYSNLERVEIFNDILDIALNFVNKGEKEKAIKIIESAYNNARYIYHHGEKWEVLIKITLKCDEIESEITRRIRDEIFSTKNSHGNKFYALEKNLVKLIERGNIEKAERIIKTVVHFTEKEKGFWSRERVFLSGVALKFTEKEAVKEAFETARLIKNPDEHSDYKHWTLDDVVSKIVESKNASAEEIFKEACLSYDEEVCPHALGDIAIKFAWEGNIDKALEIARSIKRSPQAKVHALLGIARVPASANEEIITQALSGVIKEMPEEDSKKMVNVMIRRERSIALNIIEEAINVARSDDAFWSSHHLGNVASVSNWIGEERRAMEIMEEAIDTACSIEDFLSKSWALRDIVSQLVKMGKIKKALEIARSIEDPEENSFAMVKIASNISQTEVDEEMAKEEVVKETKKSIEEAIRQGMVFDKLSALVEAIQETGLKIDLSEYSREAEETGLFLKGQKEHPTKVAIELGWVFKNLWLARSLYAKAGSDEKVKDMDKRLKWMGRFSPLDIRPLEEEKMNLFVEREEFRQLDTNIAIRNGGSIAICGERGSGKSTLVNNYLSKYKNDLGCLVVKMECSTYYDGCEFMRFLFQKIIEAIKSSERFEELKKEERERIEDLDEQLKFVISRESGFEAGVSSNILLNFHTKLSRKKSLTTYGFNHPQIITTIKKVLEEQSANFSRIFIIIDEFDKLDVGEEEDFKRIKYRILQDLRAIFSIGGVYFILIGLEKHFQFEVKDEGKAIEDSAFDDIIHLKLDNEEAHHFLSEILERRLKWLNLNELFDESGKEEMIKRAKGSPRELIRLLSKAIAYWMDKGVYRFDQKTVEELV